MWGKPSCTGEPRRGWREAGPLERAGLYLEQLGARREGLKSHLQRWLEWDLVCGFTFLSSAWPSENRGWNGSDLPHVAQTG